MTRRLLALLADQRSIDGIAFSVGGLVAFALYVGVVA